VRLQVSGKTVRPGLIKSEIKWRFFLFILYLSPMKYSLFIFLSLIQSSLFSQVEISLRLDKGRTYNLSTSNKNTIIELNGDAETRTVNTEKGQYTYTMLEDIDSLYLVQVEFKHFSLEVETADKTILYSSDINDNKDVTSTILRRITNRPFKVIMRKDYTWKEVQGLDSIFLQSYSVYNLNEDVKQQVDRSIRESLKGFTRQDASLTAVMYGAKKIKPGEVWTSQFVTEHAIPTLDSCTYHFSETTGDFVGVTGSGTVVSLEDENETEGVSVSYQLKGQTSHSVKFFKNSFWIYEAVVKTEISGNAVIKENNSSEKKLVPMRIISEATISGF
jgi:hypothetical protein